MRIQHLHVQHRVDGHLDVVPSDADLLRDVERLLLEVVPVGDALHERHQDMESRLQRAAVLAETLDDIGALLGHHRSGAPDRDHHDEAITMNT